MKYIFKKIKNKILRFVYKNKTFKTEEEFYTYFFTKNPSWSSPEANEDENMRWLEIKAEIKTLTNGKPISILEIGCGRGWLCQKMVEYGSVIGIDPVEPVIKYAKKLFPKIEFYPLIPNTFIKQFPTKQFDLIVSTEVLEHIDNKNAFMTDVNNLLKTNGTIILTTPRAEHFKDFIEFYGQDKKQPIEEWMTEEELNDLFIRNKFIITNKKFFSPLNSKNGIVLMTQLWTCKKI